jgi:D-alanyl-D-alanine dipeptidase
VNNNEKNITKNDTNFVKLNDLSSEFVYDIKYATDDNFLKQKVYDCPECYLRLNTAKAIIKANEDFKQMGFRLKIFDCYRPHDVQKKMWAILPGTHYVANPKRGSIHNRGGAVDVTLVDNQGNELDMGTPFDYFGKEAHHTYTKHSNTIQNNRNILKNTLKKHGFKSIYSEWWHYEILGARQEKISNFKWQCD